MDDVVVERTRAGDADAWRALVEQYLGLVRAICIGYGLDERASTEVNQVVWLRLAEHLPRIRTPDAIGGWIAATTRGECLDPRRGCHRNGSSTTAVHGGNGDGHHGVDGLAPAFARLGIHCQRLLRLTATRPPPADEHVSAALDIPADKVRAACARCLERLGRMAAADGRTVRAEMRRLVADGGAVPPSWWEATAPAFAWLSLDAPSADLVYDSTTPSIQAAGAARAVARRPVREVRFSAGVDGVELALDRRDDGMLLTGRLASGRATAVTVHWPDGNQATGSDGDGAFLVEHLPIAPLCVEVDGIRPFKTGWIIP